MILPEGDERRFTPPRTTATILFVDKKTDKVLYGIADATLIRYITPSEIGFVDHRGHIRSASINAAEKLEIEWSDL